MIGTFWPRLFWAYLVLLTLALGLAHNEADPDLWHRFAMAEYLEKTGRFPPPEQFSYLSDTHRTADHEWGCAPLFFAMWRAGGGWGLIALKVGVLLALMVLVETAGLGPRRPTLWDLALDAFVLLTLMLVFNSTIRCMAFTHLFFAGWLWCYQKERKGAPIQIVIYTLTACLWANLHGGFIFGLGWLALLTGVDFFQGGRWKMRLAALVLALLATLINPFGIDLWRVTVQALTVSRVGFPEWQSPLESWWRNPGGVYSFLVVGAGVAVAMRGWREGGRSLMSVPALLLGVVFVFSLSSLRHAGLFAIAAGVFLPEILASPARSVQPAGRTSAIDGTRVWAKILPLSLVIAALLAALFAAITACLTGKIGLILPKDTCPAGAVETLRARAVKGNLLTTFNYGSYALWQLRGQMRVSMDGRYDLVYTPATARRVQDFFLNLPDGPSLISTPRPDAILSPTMAPVVPVLRANRAWVQIYSDAQATVFVPVRPRAKVDLP